MIQKDFAKVLTHNILHDTSTQTTFEEPISYKLIGRFDKCLLQTEQDLPILNDINGSIEIESNYNIKHIRKYRYDFCPTFFTFV